MTRRMIGPAALLLVGLALPTPKALAAEIKVLSTGNMSSVMAELKGPFEQATGHKLVIEFGSTPRIKTRVLAEPVDLTINERYVLDDLVKQGRVVAASVMDVARSPLGIGVRAGAQKPDISTSEALKRTLLAADSIVYPDPSGGAQDGTYFVDLIMRLGIADALKPKMKLSQGGDAAAQTVASGAAQLGIAQRRNFISLKGVELLEPLPDIPGIKFLMQAGVVTGAREPEAAAALAKYLASPAAAPTIIKLGMEPYTSP
jgi:molybdate transport system substrate-binding protein